MGDDMSRAGKGITNATMEYLGKIRCEWGNKVRKLHGTESEVYC
jgi:hypothetical protein